MNVLLLYATTEGQTKKIAEHLAGTLRAGHTVTLHDMASNAKPPDVETFGAVICAASVHQGYHQDAAIDFVTATAAKLNARSTAYLSVSLAAAMPESRGEAQQYCERFLETTGLKPIAALTVAGAIRLSGYDYFERQVMKYILTQRGITDLTADYEFTDWDGLDKFARDFVERRAAAGDAGKAA